MNTESVSDHDYVSAVADLNGLVTATFELSVRLTKYEGNSRKQIASATFAKINLCALSITKLLPPDSKILPREETAIMNRENFCDVSSVASLCRNLIEASNLLYYFALDEAPEEETKLRLLIADYQYLRGSLAVLRLADGLGAAISKFERNVAKVRDNLEASSEFKKLNVRFRREILRGRKVAVLSHREISKKRGLVDSHFTATYKHLSGHVHSDAYALMDLISGDKLGGPMTIEIRHSLFGLIREATRYLAMTCKDMMALFPNFEMSETGLNKIKTFIEQ